MTPERYRQVGELFQSVLDRPAVERELYLAKACSGDDELRSEVDALLRHHLETGRFLAPLNEEAVKQEPTPNSIGPYVIGRLLGEGGMGTVYLAEQAEPFRREVALKLIRPGMGSKSVIARFEAERRTLAMMDHPNIAHVFDAGTTTQGLPYFAMELVEGVPLTTYCEQKGLPIPERLHLFIQVCQATMYNLATLYSSENRYPEALALFEENRAARGKVWPPDHPRTRRLLGNLAEVYENMGRHEDAVLLDETVWATQRRVLGEEHPDTLDTVESLAELYSSTQPERAEVLYKQAADGYRRTLGPRHGNTILAVINLAQFWIDEKKFAQAESLLRQELDALGAGETGHDPMYRYRLMTLLGYATAAQQRRSTAEPLLKDVYEGLVRNASVAQDQEDVADAGELVIQAYTQWGKQPAATAEWKQRVAADRIRLATLKP
jgi:tetratricopeptide (TPR) repeat protein